MHDHIIDKRPLRIQQRRILRLADGKPGSIVHRNMLDGGKRFGPGKPNIAHVADVKNTYAVAHRIVLGHDAAGRGVFNRHVPAVEFHHLGPHLAMDAIQRGLADGQGGRLNSGQ